MWVGWGTVRVYPIDCARRQPCYYYNLSPGFAALFPGSEEEKVTARPSGLPARPPGPRVMGPQAQTTRRAADTGTRDLALGGPPTYTTCRHVRGEGGGPWRCSTHPRRPDVSPMPAWHPHARRSRCLLEPAQSGQSASQPVSQSSGRRIHTVHIPGGRSRMYPECRLKPSVPSSHS